jgi:branched-chain amino acid transport system permease protein
MGTIAPKSFYFHLTFLTIAMLILGGMRSVSGAIAGTIAIAVGFELVRGLENGPEVFGVQLPTMFGLTGFFLGAVIVLVLAFRPDGILGNDEFEDYWRLFRARKNKS